MASSLLVPTQSTNYAGNNASTSQQDTSSNTSQYYTYTPGQQALQQQLGGAYSGLLNGNIPTSYTQNPSLLAAYNNTFNQSIAPQLALSGGAGSPQLQSNYTQGLLQQLTGQYNTGLQNYQNTLSGAAGFGLTNTGQNTQGATQAATANLGTGNSNTTVQQPYTLLQLLSML